MRKLMAIMVAMLSLASIAMAFDVSESFVSGSENRKAHVATYVVSAPATTNATVMLNLGTSGSGTLYYSFYSDNANAEFVVTYGINMSFSNDLTNTNVYTNGSTNGQTWTYGDMQSPNLSYATGYAKLLTSWVKTGANPSAWVNVATAATPVQSYRFSGHGWHTVPVNYIVKARTWYVVSVSNASGAGTNATLTIVPQVVLK